MTHDGNPTGRTQVFRDASASRRRVTGAPREVGHVCSTSTFGSRGRRAVGGEFSNRDTEMIPPQMTASMPW